jgi:predicted  nucleic acid-binding Zn-ribbon protein
VSVAKATVNAPLQMAIKVGRKKYGTTLEGTCRTVNVSRNGAYFLSSQNYEVGETLEVVLNYKEGDLALSVPDKVVRQDKPKETFQRGIAIQLKK